MIAKAGIEDIPQIMQLVNSAYRGPEAKKGWTHEADLIEGNLRTDEFLLRKMFENPRAAILKYLVNEQIAGCVYLEKKKNKMYLGMLSVSPHIQAQGIGKKLLQAGEEYASEMHCTVMEMTVISVRKELIAWYERQGYHKTGHTKPFHDDARFGIPRQQIEFIVMEKTVKSPL